MGQPSAFRVSGNFLTPFTLLLGSLEIHVSAFSVSAFSVWCECLSLASGQLVEVGSSHSLPTCRGLMGG